MDQEIFLLFKIEKYGELVKIKAEELKEYFIPINVLVIYVYKSKRLYIWVGKEAKNYIKRYIASVESQITELDDRIRVLRHFTIEGGEEPWDFFDQLEIEKEVFTKNVHNWDNFEKEIINNIKKLEKEVNTYYDDAQFNLVIDKTLDIIKLAKKIDKNDIIEEKTKFIENIQENRDKLKVEIDSKKEIDILIVQLENLLLDEKYEKAHDVAEEIKNIYNNIQERPLKRHRSILDNEEKLYESWKLEKEELSKQEEEIRRKIIWMKKNLKQSIDERNPNEAKQMNEKMLETSKKSVDINFKKKIMEDYDEYIKIIKRLEETKLLKYKIFEKLDRAKELSDNNKIVEAFQKIEEAFKLVQENNLDDYKEDIERINKKIKKKKEISDAQNELLIRLQKNVDLNIENENYKIALPNCERLIELSRELSNTEIKTKYSEIYNNILDLLAKQKEENAKKKEEVLKQKEILSNILDIEEDIAPLFEELSIEDVIGDLSDDIDEIFNQITDVLENNRVEIKEDIQTTNTIKTASGEVFEQKIKTKVEKKKLNELNEPLPVKITVHSGIENPFDEYIEEAIVQDNIPYNFEISEVFINGEIPDQEPEKSLTDSGLEIKWLFDKIPPKKKIGIEYDLKPRVSRTVVFPLDNSLKIIKSHSNLNPLNMEGLFDARLKFANKFKKELNSVVIEDIVPMDYIYDIKRPENISKSLDDSEDIGSLIKWKVNNIPLDETLNHHYQLLELYKFEELKIKTNKLSENLLNSLDENKIGEAKINSKEIIELLEGYK